MKLKGLVLGTTVAIAALSALGFRANAQTTSFDEPTVLETIDDISFRHSGTYDSDRTIVRQIDHIFGFGLPGDASYPELELDRNGAGLLQAYHELMILQTQNTPTIRVPDLANPYNTSLQLLPGAQAGSRVVGTELNFEPLPRR